MSLLFGRRSAWKSSRIEKQGDYMHHLPSLWPEFSLVACDLRMRIIAFCCFLWEFGHPISFNPLQIPTWLC